MSNQTLLQVLIWTVFFHIQIWSPVLLLLLLHLPLFWYIDYIIECLHTSILLCNCRLMLNNVCGIRRYPLTPSRKHFGKAVARSSKSAIAKEALKDPTTRGYYSYKNGISSPEEAEVFVLSQKPVHVAKCTLGRIHLEIHHGSITKLCPHSSLPTIVLHTHSET